MTGLSGILPDFTTFQIVHQNLAVRDERGIINFLYVSVIFKPKKSFNMHGVNMKNILILFL